MYNTIFNINFNSYYCNLGITDRKKVRGEGGGGGNVMERRREGVRKNKFVEEDATKSG